jgi:hypothetical protein
MNATIQDYHQRCVRNGKYFVARKLLGFLRNSKITLGLGDIDFEVELILNACGYNTYSVDKWGVATYRK